MATLAHVMETSVDAPVDASPCYEILVWRALPTSENPDEPGPALTYVSRGPPARAKSFAAIAGERMRVAGADVCMLGGMDAFAVAAACALRGYMSGGLRAFGPPGLARVAHQPAATPCTWRDGKRPRRASARGFFARRVRAVPAHLAVATDEHGLASRVYTWGFEVFDEMSFAIAREHATRETKKMAKGACVVVIVVFFAPEGLLPATSSTTWNGRGPACRRRRSTNGGRSPTRPWACSRRWCPGACSRARCA